MVKNVCFFLLLRLTVWASLCRMMYVIFIAHSLNLLWPQQDSDFKRRGLQAWFVTSLIVWKPILFQYSAYTQVWCGNLESPVLTHREWTLCSSWRHVVSNSETCEMKKMCIFIYCGLFNEGEGKAAILRIWHIKDFFCLCVCALKQVWRRSFILFFYHCYVKNICAFFNTHSQATILVRLCNLTESNSTNMPLLCWIAFTIVNGVGRTLETLSTTTQFQ